jgi:hypothetical protein
VIAFYRVGVDELHHLSVYSVWDEGFSESTRGWVSEALRILVTLCSELKDMIERYD